MAKKSKIVGNNRRRAVVARYAERRADLKRTIASTTSTPEQRVEALRALQRLPRDASPTRLRNRDLVDGRPRGIVGKVGLSRIRFRDMAHRGQLPGITKSSW